MDYRQIYRKTEFFTPFPDPEQVLAERSRSLLLPVGVVNFGEFDRQFDHPVLIALPVEPEDGLLGEGRDDHYTASCRENWLGYSCQGERWDIDCALPFFWRHSEPDGHLLAPHYDRVHGHFSKVKACFEAHGAIAYPLPEDAAPPDPDPLISLGGPTPCGQNWSAYDEQLEWLNEGTEEEDIAIYSEAGHRYRYIATVTEYFYKGTGDTAHFFYEPISRSVRMVVDYG